MPSLYTEIDINASRSQLWQLLLCKEDWLKWNTFLFDRDPSKPFVQGRTVQLSLKRSREEVETEFAPLILRLQPETCLRWVYEAPGFRSQHVFELQDVDRRRTRYAHRVQFSGLATRLFLPFLRRDEQQGMQRMARELKQYAENWR